MSFDFYAIKIQAESKASDDYFLGYFFGKTGENLDYRFICFPRKYSGKSHLELEKPFSEYKEFIHQFYQSLNETVPEMVESTKEFSAYIGTQIRKLGGSGTQNLKFTRMIEENHQDLLRSEIRDFFKNWTSEVTLHISVELSTFSQISQNENLQNKVQSLLEEAGVDREDLKNIPDFYPIMDPMTGMSIEEFEIGSTIWCSITNFPEKESKASFLKKFADFFDEEGKNIVPFEGIITSKEILPGGKGVLIKIQIGDTFFAKSVVLKSMRLMQDIHKMQNRFPQMKEKEIPFENIVSKAAKSDYTDKKNRIEKAPDEKPVFDFFSILIIAAIIIITIFIFFFFFLT